MAGGKLGTVFVELDLDSTNYERKQLKILETAKVVALDTEKNYEQLGIKSSRTFDLMRQAAENAYQGIAHSSRSTANDIIRAEEAKNAKVMALNEQQFGKQVTFIDEIKNHWMIATAIIAGAIHTVHSTFDKVIMKTAELGTEMTKLSQQTSLSVETLSSLRYAAALSETDFNSLVKGVGLLSRNLVTQDENGKNAASVMNALGISYKNANGQLLPTEELLMKIADKFMMTKDSAEKTAYSMILFGRAGKEMIPFLNEGGAGIDELMKKAKELGITFTGETAKAAKEFEDNMKTLKFHVEGLWQSIGNKLIPILNQLFKMEPGKSLSMKGLESQIAADEKTIASGKVFGFISVTEEGMKIIKDRLAKNIKEKNELLNELYSHKTTSMEGNLDMKGNLKPLPGKGKGDETVNNWDDPNKWLQYQLQVAGEADKAWSDYYKDKSDMEKEEARLLKVFTDTYMKESEEASKALIERDKDRIKSFDIMFKSYEDQIANVNQLEKSYGISVEDAAKKRIELYKNELQVQNDKFNTIKGNTIEESKQREKTTEEITKINGKLLEQQGILQDRTAWGGYNKAIHSIADEYSNTGKNIESATRSIFGSIENGINTFLDKTSTGFMKWGQLVTSVMNSAMRQMMQVGITKPIVGAMATAMTPGTVGAASSGSGASGVGMMGGLIGQALPMVGAGAVGYQVGGVGGALGGALGYLGGSAAIGTTLGGTVTAAIGSAFGGALASVATMVLPVVGTIIGVVAGKFLGKLFGGGKEEPPHPMVGLTIKNGIVGSSMTNVIRGSAGEDNIKPFTEYREKVKNELSRLGFDISRFAKNWAIEVQDMKGKTSAEISAMLTTQFYNTINADSKLKLNQYKQGKETLPETISRVLTSFESLNKTMELLHKSTFQANAAGLGFSQTLIKLLGGMDAATSKIDFFFKNFYSPEDQNKRTLEAARKNILSVFTPGTQQPRSRDEFAKMVESIDTTTERGQKLFAAMMNISGSLDLIFKSQEQQAQVTTDAVKAQYEIVSQFVVSFTSLKSSIGQYQSDRSRKAWGMSDYQNYYGQLQGQLNGLSTSSPDYFAKSLDIQTQMFETLKSMDSLASQQIDQTKQTISQLTSLSQSIEKSIRSMYTGELAPTQSREYVQSQYNILKGRTQSGDATDIQNFLDYTQEYLKFFKTFSGADDYKSIFDTTVKDMSDVKVNVDNATATATDTLTTLQSYVSSTGSSIDTLNGKLNGLAKSVDDVVGKLNNTTIATNTTNGQTMVTVNIDGKTVANAVATQIKTGNDELHNAIGQVVTYAWEQKGK